MSSFLSTSKAVRESRKLWNVSGDGRPWTVELDVRDLGGHLDFTGRARAGTLARDRSNWPRCLLWDGWLPGLNGISLLESGTLGLLPLVFLRIGCWISAWVLILLTILGS